jgi:hypothetical protein
MFDGVVTAEAVTAELPFSRAEFLEAFAAYTSAEQAFGSDFLAVEP